MPRTRFFPLVQRDDNDDIQLVLTPAHSDVLRFSNTIDDQHSADTEPRYDPESQTSSDEYRQQNSTYVQGITPDAQTTGLPPRERRAQHTTYEFQGRPNSSWRLQNAVSKFKVPKFAAPWQHEVLYSPSKPDGSSTIRVFDARAQRNRVFLNSLIQWFATISVTVLMAGCLYGFSKQDYLTQTQKYTFNACITLLSLTLAGVVIKAFRAYAKLLRWRVLASQYRNLQDFELIMNCDSQSEVLRLLWAGRTPGKIGLNTTQLLCLLSLSTVIGLQIVIGITGLTYSVDTAENFVDTVWGTVARAALWNVVYTDDELSSNSSINAQLGAVNQFGGVGQVFWIDYGVPLGEEQNGTNTVYTPDNSTFAYQFVDWSPDPSSSLSVDTDRYVTARATCVNLKLLNNTGWSNNQTLHYIDEHGAERRISSRDTSKLTTTYISNATFPAACGPRCAQTLVLNTGDWNATANNGTVIPSLLMTCNTTVSTVYNSKSCQNVTVCELPDLQASMWAGSIGFGGINYANVDRYTRGIEYKNYPFESTFSWDGETDNEFYTNPDQVAGTVSYFAMAGLAAYDSTGPKVNVSGYTPVIASQLNVKWHYTIPTLTIVPFVQFLVLLVVCFWANGAFIKDGSYFSTARLLRPIVDKLGSGGSALTGDEIATALTNIEILYGATNTKHADDTQYSNVIESEDAEWKLAVIEKTEGYSHSVEGGWRPGKRFPEGRYD